MGGVFLKTVIVYYTFGGATKKEAEKLAAQMGCEAVRVQEKKKRNLFSAFIPGAPWAMKRKASDIQPLGVDLADYERIVIGAPIWAGYPAPAFNAIVKLLPRGKDVDLFLCSGGGETPESSAGTRKLIQDAGCTVASYRDVNTGEKPAKLKT